MFEAPHWLSLESSWSRIAEIFDRGHTLEASKWSILEPKTRILYRGYIVEASKWLSLNPKRRILDRDHTFEATHWLSLESSWRRRAESSTGVTRLGNIGVRRCCK